MSATAVVSSNVNDASRPKLRVPVLIALLNRPNPPMMAEIDAVPNTRATDPRPAGPRTAAVANTAHS